jgi:hypothetical protein
MNQTQSKQMETNIKDQDKDQFYQNQNNFTTEQKLGSLKRLTRSQTLS